MSRARQMVLGASVCLATFGGAPAAEAKIIHHTHHIASRPSAHHSHTAYAETHHTSKTRLAAATSHHDGHYSHLEYADRHFHEHLRYAGYHGHYRYRDGHYRYASAEYRHSYLQCVPYAREVSHIDLSGDAFLWWAEASGRYARGDAPAEGAVLNFRAIGRMPLGHVAVVTSVIDSRTILVTQANWIPGTITNDVTMQDVSPDNDWSQVEVELGDSSKWGAAYPTYGFIYNQPDNGSVIAAATDPAAQGTEVAEAPRAVVVQTDAPDRDLQ